MEPLSEEQTQQLVTIVTDLARQGRTAELLEFLDHGMPADVQDREGNTPLMLAAYHGHTETVRALIGRGADVDLRNARDQSPVAGALFKGEDAIVEALVGAGADLDAGTPSARATAEMFGRTALLG
ncbi:ankyrin repeat domain-containing protein [Streptomyces sp. NPDC006296]|uniref:ankyrin repeat domain-containing protein n=1 Tax=Streptomyces sp. NPDC006296 TaxID=3156746 RepID=UPI0033A1FE02